MKEIYTLDLTGSKNTGCLNNSDVITHGYWMISFRGDGTYNAWRVNAEARITGYRVSCDDRYGTRPVITVSKSSIFES